MFPTLFLLKPFLWQSSQPTYFRPLKIETQRALRGRKGRGVSLGVGGWGVCVAREGGDLELRSS